MATARSTISFFALACSLALIGCSEGVAPAPAVDPAPASAANMPPPLSSVDPCQLLKEPEVGRVFSGAGPGQRDLADDPYGVLTCVWKSGDLSVKVQVFDAPPGSAESELRSLSFGLVDPKSPAAGTAVRIEPFAGIGDGSAGMVETIDAARGIRAAAAVAATQRGSRLAIVTAPSLAGRERADALKDLQDLVRDVANRL